MRPFPRSTPAGDPSLRWPDDDSYHALVDPYWLRVLVDRIHAPLAIARMCRRFFLLRCIP